MNALRSVDRNGGLDPFMLKSKDSVLSPKALRLKRAIAKKAAKQGRLTIRKGGRRKAPLAESFRVSGELSARAAAACSRRCLPRTG